MNGSADIKLNPIRKLTIFRRVIYTLQFRTLRKVYHKLDVLLHLSILNDRGQPTFVYMLTHINEVIDDGCPALTTRTLDASKR